MVENLPPETLLKLWRSGKPLDKACLEFCDKPLIKVYQTKPPKSVSTNSLAILSHSFNISAAEYKLKENLAEKLIVGDLVGLGFNPPVKPQDIPITIPPHLWVAKNMHLNTSQLYGDGIHYEKIRIFPLSEIEKIQPTIKKQILALEKPTPRKVGRPDNKFRVTAAYLHLKERGLINYDASLSANVEIIQQAILEIFPEMCTVYGVGRETIRIAIGKQFQIDKDSNKFSNKL